MTSSGLSGPLLDHDDFVRLIHNGAWSFLARQLGLPPKLPPLSEAAHLPVDSLQIIELDDFHRSIEKFFGLKNTAPARPTEKIGDYAVRLFSLWRNGPMGVTFYTSGSTGVPQPSLHSEDMLRQEMAEAAILFSHPRRVVATVPLLHSYGFIFGILLPKVLNIETVHVPPLPTIVLDTLKPGDLIVSFPMLFSRLQGTPPPQVTGLSATAPCPDDIFQEIADKGFAGLAEIYGASETGAIAVRLGPGWFHLLSYWQKIGDDCLARRLPSGDTLLYPLPDYLNWQDSKHFLPLGRRDRAVQVGGVNVYPGRVAAVIKEHDAVLECAVRLMTPQEGERLKAFVVIDPKADRNTVRSELTALMKSCLSPPERPGSLMFGSTLPKSVSDKYTDWPIR